MLLVGALVVGVYLWHKRRQAADQAVVDQSGALTPLPVADAGLYPMYGAQAGTPLGGQASTVPGPQGVPGPTGPSPYCTSSASCPTGYSCVSGLCQTATTPVGGGTGCKKDKDCAKGERCNNGTCQPKGVKTSACSPPCVAPKTCVNGKCVPPVSAPTQTATPLPAPGPPGTMTYSTESAHGSAPPAVTNTGQVAGTLTAKDKGKVAKNA